MDARRKKWWRVARALAIGLAWPALWGCDARCAESGTPARALPPGNAVIGQLGGAAVAIPRDYARVVEYAGEPPRLGQDAGPPPPRSFESRLRSIGMLVQDRDLSPLGPTNQAAYRRRGFHDRDWIEFEVAAGSALSFGEDKFERPYEFRLPGNEWRRFYVYEPLPMVHGLVAYRAVKDLGLGLVLEEDNPRHAAFSHTLYFAHEQGRLVAAIRCGSTAVVGGSATCHHDFVLWPEMKAEIRLRYDRDLLARWRDMQRRYRDLVLGFRVKTASGPQRAAP